MSDLDKSDAVREDIGWRDLIVVKALRGGTLLAAKHAEAEVVLVSVPLQHHNRPLLGLERWEKLESGQVDLMPVYSALKCGSGRRRHLIDHESVILPSRYIIPTHDCLGREG